MFKKRTDYSVVIKQKQSVRFYFIILDCYVILMFVIRK